MAGYSASKGGGRDSLTQAPRPVLAAQGISVHGVWRIDPKAFKRRLLRRWASLARH